MSDTRRLVSIESRRRTKKACLTCQRKKLKCNGLQPCATCSSRSNQCTYANDRATPTRSHGSSHQHQQHQQHQLNRRSPSSQAQTYPYALPSQQLPLPQMGRSNSVLKSYQIPDEHSVDRTRLPPNDSERLSRQLQTENSYRSPTPSVIDTNPELSISLNQAPYVKENASLGQPVVTAEEISRSSSKVNVDGENLEEQSRLLEDGSGRLLYLGESASLSYLDTIRRVVENTLGPSDFTRDSHKNKIVEGSISTSRRATYVLPDREAAEFLIDSFLSNTVGMIHIFDREAFSNEVAAIYTNPLHAEQSRLSILNLVFAVGLQLTRSSAAHNFLENQILKRLDGGNIDRAETFYLNATHFNDALSGFEDGDITSVQGLLLITVFMLTVAKRNAAWAYLGMAIRSAYALGLHRKQTNLAFTLPEQRLRQNIWRSLYVMDCFLSAMLGRPNGISSRDATDSFVDDNPKLTSTPPEENLELDALAVSVRSSCLIGDILSLVYAERKISVKLAHAISNKFQIWKSSIPKILHWKNISMPNEDPKATLAQLHVNLSYFHGIILLMRPFLLQKILSQVRPSNSSKGYSQPPHKSTRTETGSASIEQFPSACVRAALHSIDAVQSALLKRALPRRDPFVIYWLFTAALIVFSNGFCTVYSDVENSHAMETALNLHRYLGEADPLARRFLQILLAFDRVITRDTTSHIAPTTSKSSGKDVFSTFFGDPSTDNGPQMKSGRNDMETNIPADRTKWSDTQTQPKEVRLEPQMEQEMMQDIWPGLDMAGISPSDDLLDFDAFLTTLSQDTTYQQDLWMPLYRTTDLH